MAQAVKKVLTHIEIDAQVDILGHKELHSGAAEIIARVRDVGSQGMVEHNFEAIITEAATQAYRQQLELADDGRIHINNKCVLPSQDEERTWYTHVILSRRKS